MQGTLTPPLITLDAHHALRLVTTYYALGRPRLARLAASDVVHIAPEAAQAAVVVVACGNGAGFTARHLDAILNSPQRDLWPEARQLFRLRRDPTEREHARVVKLVANLIHGVDTHEHRTEMLAAAAHIGVLERSVMRRMLIEPFLEMREGFTNSDHLLRTAAIAQFNALLLR